jgi:hypothetical protein
LERSESVEWVMPAMRPQGGSAQFADRAGEPTAPAAALYTVNPTRFYLRQGAVERAGGSAAFGPAAM